MASKVGKKIAIPDHIINNEKVNQILEIEGKISKNFKKGILQIEEYHLIDEMYLKKYYPETILFRSLIIYGDKYGDNKLHGLVLKKQRVCLLTRKLTNFDKISGK